MEGDNYSHCPSVDHAPQADTIHLLENGGIAENGSWDELIQRKEKFFRLYQMQSGEVE